MANLCNQAMKGWSATGELDMIMKGRIVSIGMRGFINLILLLTLTWILIVDMQYITDICHHCSYFVTPQLIFYQYSLIVLSNSIMLHFLTRAFE